MPVRALLDANVFLFALERPASNSRRVVRLLVEGRVRGVVTDRIVREVLGYARRHYGKDVASRFRDVLLLACELVLEGDLEDPGRYVALVGTKDAGALAAVRALGLPHLVSTDSDFRGIPEWKTPRAFLAAIGEPPRSGEE